MSDRRRTQEPEPWRYAAYAEQCWCVRSGKPCERHEQWQDGFDAATRWCPHPVTREAVKALMREVTDG